MKIQQQICYLTYQSFPAETANSLQTISNIKYLVRNGADVELIFPLREKNSNTSADEIKKYYSGIDNDENYDESLSILAGAKKEVFEFFDNVKVNEENETLRKNRLELINMLCKTFQNFISLGSGLIQSQRPQCQF